LSIPAQGTDPDKARLNTLKNLPIQLGNTVYRRHEAEKKKDVVQAIKKMMPEERAAILQQMAEMNAANATNNETMPPSPTLI
jgi:hypothetical protein